MLNGAGIAAPGQSERQVRPMIAVFAHNLYFQSRGARSSAAWATAAYLRAILSRHDGATSDLPQEAAAEAECRVSPCFGSELGAPAARFLK